MNCKHIKTGFLTQLLVIISICMFLKCTNPIKNCTTCPEQQKVKTKAPKNQRMR